MDVEADFQRDLGNGVWMLLARLGHRLSVPLATESVLRIFLNLQHRVIPKRRRRVFWSRELQGRPLLQDEKAAMERIAAISERGDDLGPFQSATMLNARYRDQLFHDWGIQHFHLDLVRGKKAKKRPSYFARRTRELLFALVHDDAVYFIDRQPHDESSLEAFLDDELIEILHQNWPEAIAQHRMVTPKAPRFRVPREERIAQLQRCRERGVEVFTWTADGTCYGPIGGGYATDGTSFRVVIDADRMIAEALDVEQLYRANAEGIAGEILGRRGRRLPSLRFELRVERELEKLAFYVYESQLGEPIVLSVNAA